MLKVLQMIFVAPAQHESSTNLPHFLVLLLLSLLPLLLQLDSLLLVHQQLVSLRQEGKMKFPVASLGLSSITCVLLIGGVHVTLIIHFMHVHAGEEGSASLMLSDM